MLPSRSRLRRSLPSRRGWGVECFALDEEAEWCQAWLAGLGEAGQQAGQADDPGGGQGIQGRRTPVAMLAEVVMLPQAQRAEQADGGARAEALATGVRVAVRAGPAGALLERFRF